MQTEKQRERLVELIKSAEKEFSNTGKPILDIEEYVADYLIANGVVVFPHKIGDKIYKNICGEKDTQEYVIVGYYCEDKPKIVHSQFVYNGKTYDHNFYVDDEGEYYYTSRAEAENALKERKENGK